MSCARKIAIAAVVLAAVAAMAGCSEREQVISYQQGKYQGKADTKPWDNALAESLHTSSTWTKGDKTSWETAITSRTQNQNEYVRIDQ